MKTDTTTSSGASPDAEGETLAAFPAAEQLTRIGRYRIEKLLGKGGFGSVYLAHDDQLQRLVAVKVPHARRLTGPEDAAAYLAEARTAAGLDYPNIVPVYDVGSTEDCPCFIVSRYIEGVPLTERIKLNRPTSGESAELVATIADALDYAHRRQVIHRDVKPGNILIDASGTPFVVDFGLASKEDQIGKGLRYAGTPAYMSPEQVRGEGHRVDGRSDIFSLGVVFYELLTGRLPFNGDSKAELLEQVRSFEPRPPRQHDDGIPKELERICIKALSKRAWERYSTARDLAEDLRHWINTQSGVKTRPTPTAAIPGLGKDIFLSHATPDKETADRLCRLIEAQGVQCWIAPRDVMPGDDYGESIIRGIEGTAMTVLLLSSHSNASIHVRNEIERATSKRKRVVPVRLEDVLPNKSLELHLSTAQWMDASALGLDQVALRLVQLSKGESSQAVPSSKLPSSNSGRLHIVPKGLRSFDAHDADFFLELLPGPRDRDGLPDSIRFWKTRIEETDADNTFAVGLIYGPSGCGKSSLVKAGLLPRLSDSVITAYVEATAEETETRLLNGLRKRCPIVPATLNLTETLAALRRRQGVPAGKKILIVLDQFEQWLHARKDEQDTELVQALRHCDGSRVQCIVMVRDDFWMAATQFMRELEFRLLEGQNSAAADLFDTDHARKVLAAFGRAFGKLPENSGETAPDAKQFLTHAVSGLAQEGKIVSVRLALFAEMMKGRPWTLTSLKEVGGTEGVAVTFLEETFSAATAPPEHRYHQKAARAVLKSLLPESGTDIKGHMRPQAELLETSGYAGRPKDFDDLIRILDSQIRLLTPTDPEGKDGAEDSATSARPGTKYYQLTHDYLVPALRDWLTRKQKETRRGRAELLLVDRADVWNARQENRQLPSLRQWLVIRFLTKKKGWTPPQRKMMDRGRRYHSMRGTALALLVTLATVAGVTIRRQVVQHEIEQQKVAEAARLADLLINADETQFTVNYPRFKELGERGLPALLNEIDQRLPTDAKDEAKEGLAKRQANAAVALLRLNQTAKVWPLLKQSRDPRTRSYLIDRLGPLGADPETIIERLDQEPDPSIRSALILSLGEFGEQAISPDERTTLTKKLFALHSTEADPGIHAAAEWLLRSWKQETQLRALNITAAKDVEQRVAKLKGLDNPEKSPHWYVNGQGQTMVVVPGPVEFMMGSPPSEAGHQDEERQHKTRIGRTFAIAAKPVTVAEFEQFRKQEGSDQGSGPDLPVVNVSWHDAAAYCNWLSEKVGIPNDQWCYEIENGKVLKMKEGYLGLEGYRLPTEAEMEYATRAGASTSRFYGETEELLPKYAWYADNSGNHTWPVGSKKPNDLGLFDVHGNVWCWCQDKYTKDQAVEDKEDDLNVTQNGRVLRGGSFSVRASVVRCAYRFDVVPKNRYVYYGFRAARTLPLVPLTPLPPPP